MKRGSPGGNAYNRAALSKKKVRQPKKASRAVIKGKGRT